MTRRFSSSHFPLVLARFGYRLLLPSCPIVLAGRSLISNHRQELVRCDSKRHLTNREINEATSLLNFPPAEIALITGTTRSFTQFGQEGNDSSQLTSERLKYDGLSASDLPVSTLSTSSFKPGLSSIR